MSKRFPFTKRTIEGLSSHDPDSKSREAEYSDAECIGLKLRVSKGGRKFFQHRYRYMGRKKCLPIEYSIRQVVIPANAPRSAAPMSHPMKLEKMVKPVEQL